MPGRQGRGVARLGASLLLALGLAAATLVAVRLGQAQVSAAITLRKTVGTNPNVCATASTLVLPSLATTGLITITNPLVVYCYQVENTGGITLTQHTLVDDRLGTLLNNFSYSLAPGASVFLTQSVAITTTTPLPLINTAVWTASTPPSFQAQGGAQAAVYRRFRGLATGPGPGGGPHVRVFDVTTGAVKHELFPFPVAFAGGVSVAMCDLTGDGQADVIVGAGPGGGPHVRVLDGLTGAQIPGPLGSFFPFSPLFAGGVQVGCTDVDGDGRADLIAGAGPGGGPHVRVFSGATGQPLASPLGSFFPYAIQFTGGVHVGGSSP